MVEGGSMPNIRMFEDQKHVWWNHRPIILLFFNKHCFGSTKQTKIFSEFDNTIKDQLRFKIDFSWLFSWSMWDVSTIYYLIALINLTCLFLYRFDWTVLLINFSSVLKSIRLECFLKIEKIYLIVYLRSISLDCLPRIDLSVVIQDLD